MKELNCSDKSGTLEPNRRINKLGPNSGWRLSAKCGPVSRSGIFEFYSFPSSTIYIHRRFISLCIANSTEWLRRRLLLSFVFFFSSFSFRYFAAEMVVSSGEEKSIYYEQ